MKTILVTGGAGFIGSNFVRYLLGTEPEVHIVNLDLLTYAGNLENLRDLPNADRHTFVKGDICDRALVDDLFRRYGIQQVVHFAAESHVDRSILGPGQFIQTNIVGTFTLLEAARQAWLVEKLVPVEQARFHHVSTDEVFGSLRPEDPAFSETTPYAPNSPYSASKASSDHLVRAYFHTYGLPVTITGGRQDIILGDGWLVLDGTPLDGSRTIFFDAIRATIDLKDINTTADVIYIQQYSNADRYWPPCSVTDTVIEQDERGAILWVTNKSIKDTEINGYFIYKHNDAVLANGDDGDLYTFGGRVVHDINKNWRARGEGALQFGNNKLQDVWAGAYTGRIEYLFNDKWNNQLQAGYEFLSGDRQDTAGTSEQFNLLWGRWPQWSELMVYNFATETRVADLTNLHRPWVGWQADPTKKLQVQARYHLLFADRQPLDGVRPGFGSGCFRGQLFTLLGRYKFNRFLSGHVLFEGFQPDNSYYADNRDDFALFARAELVFTF